MEGSAPQAGFYYQNNVAALKIIDCLFFNTDITGIYLENYEKGNHIDDIIIHRQNKIEYYQIKWSEDEDNSYTLYNLLVSSKDKKSIFKQLAEGYESVKNSGVDFSIILFTTKKESGQKRPSEGFNHGLTEIINEVFTKVKNTDIRYDALPIYSEYKDTIIKIRNECGLDEESFNDFIKKIELKFNQPPIQEIILEVKVKLLRLGIEEQLFEKLINIVVSWSISGENITKEKVLRNLGLNDRLEDKLSHYFKTVDEKNYVPNLDFQNKLEIVLKELNGGYIFIEGLPGIGKSTALTKFKDKYPNITIAYYCFIPDANYDFGQLRHKKDYFLKSICVSIENYFSEVDLPNKYSKNYEEKLNSYLEKLGSLNKKIFFIIDGLDHVHRDIGFQDNSLLNQIKGNLPDNIFFILSSQYISVLSPHVLAEIKSDSRRHIVVSRFAQPEINQYLINKGIVAGKLLNNIEEISEGIPLYLHYISEFLLNINISEYKKALSNFPYLIKGNISTYHEYLFQKIENDDLVKSILTIISLRKESSDIETIHKILSLAGFNESNINIQKVVNNFAHILKQFSGKYYSIFHNSFRDFIINKNKDNKGKFNKAIAEYYEENPYTDDAARNYFHHLFEIREYNKIIDNTTLEWIKTSWSNFRSLYEIERNIEIALNATIEIMSLADFIRIGFLKAQIERIVWNIENSNIDFPYFYLNINKIDISIRSIWDGDFVLTSKEYFIKYFINYYSKTGNLLPDNITKQGLSKILNERSPDNLIVLYKVEILNNGNIIDIFDKIDKIKWFGEDQFNTRYIKKHYSEEENVQINLNIKEEIIEFLFNQKIFDSLNLLLNSLDPKDIIYSKVQLSLAKLLLTSEKDEAIKIFKNINWDLISEKDFTNIVSYCSNYLSDEVIKDTFKSRKYLVPELNTDIVDRQEMSYQIRDDIIELFNNLKPIWIFEPSIINKYLIDISTFTGPSQLIYNSILCLSGLWNKYRKEEIKDELIEEEFKTTLRELYFEKNSIFSNFNDSIFDHDNNKYFISRSIFKLYYIIFKYAVDILSEQRIENIIYYWFSLEESLNEYKYYNIPLNIAKIINESKHKKLNPLILRLLKYAETNARKDEETSSLIESLSEIAEAYGICGFTDDFNRTYNELFDISFGISYKKDYQASYIRSALEIYHEVDPENTLKRLEEVFIIQNQFTDIGSNRMQHICISELISLIADKYPELAFTLITKEEFNILREETFEMVLTPIIRNCMEDMLILIYGIITTFPRWGKFSSRENYFINLSTILLERALVLKEYDFIRLLLEEVKYNLTIENDNYDSLYQFSELLLKYGYAIEEYSLPIIQTKELTESIEHKILQEEKFNIKYTPPDINNLINLLENNYDKFSDIIRSSFMICIKNRRNEILRREYYKLKDIFIKFYNLQTETDKEIIKANYYKIIKLYCKFKNLIIQFKPDIELRRSIILPFFNEFLSEINELCKKNLINNYIKTQFDYEHWINDIFQFITGSYEYIFEKVLNEKDIFDIIEKTSIYKVSNILLFIEEFVAEKIKPFAFLRLIKRIYSINIDTAKTILRKITENYDTATLFPERDGISTINKEMIDIIMKVDPEYGKKIMLLSYVPSNAKLGEFFLANINQIAGLYRYFGNNDVPKIYYEANLLYNKELAKGLKEKKCDYSFISNHKEILSFQQVIIKYLVILFEYPVFKIREEALKSLFNLVNFNSELLSDLIKFSIKDGTDNQIELALTLIYGLSIKKGDLIIPFKNDLFNLSNKKHFNILELLKDIMLFLDNNYSNFLNATEKEILTNLNTEGKIIFTKKVISTLKGRKFLYSHFQSDLLYKLLKNQKDDYEIMDEIYTDLSLNKNLGNHSSESESYIHKNYNINTNFDAIEIYTPYTDEVKSSINSIFASKIINSDYEKDFVNDMKYQFRIYDPSKLLYKNVSRPSYINWIPDSISESDFNSFSDMNNIENYFLKREDNFVTLFEYGSQRSQETNREHEFTCYFNIYSYLKTKSYNIPKEGLRLLPYFALENYYTNELPKKEFISTDYPENEIRPILEISQNSFRGETDLKIAMLISDVIVDLGLKKVKLLDILLENDNENIDAFHWQNSYSDGRRRYKPTSEGFTLKINKNIIKEFLLKNNMEMCFNISFRRSTTKYKPENEMIWNKYSKQFTTTLQ